MEATNSTNYASEIFCFDDFNSFPPQWLIKGHRCTLLSKLLRLLIDIQQSWVDTCVIIWVEINEWKNKHLTFLYTSLIECPEEVLHVASVVRRMCTWFVENTCRLPKNVCIVRYGWYDIRSLSFQHVLILNGGKCRWRWTSILDDRYALVTN